MAHMLGLAGKNFKSSYYKYVQNIRKKDVQRIKGKYSLNENISREK